MQLKSMANVLVTRPISREICKAVGTVCLPNGINLAYQVYELHPLQEGVQQVRAGVEHALASNMEDKVVMIMGFAAAGTAWLPTIRELCSRGDKISGWEVVVFDNRGVGRSTCPPCKDQYTTDAMAADTVALLDHLGWCKAHVVGHSMGAMIAARLAVAAPHRVASLTLISTSGGGFEAVPLNTRALWIGLKGVLSRGCHLDAVKRAEVDLAFHFSPKLLRTKDPLTGRTIRELLVEEYVASSEENSPQPRGGEQGQLNAILKHGLSSTERRRLAAAGFPIKVIHGSEDILAEPRHARRLARQLRAPFIVVEGAHFIPRDCAVQIVDELLSMVEAVRDGATHVDAVHPTIEEVTCLQFCCRCCCA